MLANGKSPSSNSLSDQRSSERKSSRSSEQERKSSRSSDQNRIIISNNNEPMGDCNEGQNQPLPTVSVGEIQVNIQEPESSNQEGPSTDSAGLPSQEPSAASSDNTTQDHVHKQPCDTSLQSTKGEEEKHSHTDKDNETEQPPDLSKQQQTIVISSASPERGGSDDASRLPRATTGADPPVSPSKVKTLTGIFVAKDTLGGDEPPTTSTFSQRLMKRKSSQGKKGAGSKDGGVSGSGSRRLCDEEDELSEVEPDAVPSEVRDWLALTFTRSMSNMKRRGDDKPKFRSVAHAIRAGIMVDR